MMTTKRTLELGREAIAAISDYYAEPRWMREARLAAWEQYEAMAWPSRKEEAWRRTPLRRFPLEGGRIVLGDSAPLPDEAWPDCWMQPLAPQALSAGLLLHHNGEQRYADLDPRLQARGIVFADLHRALHTHGDLIRRYWMRGAWARPDFNRFTALHAALWHGGTFVHVPQGVRVERPLQSLIAYDEAGGMGLHHTLVIAEAGSHLTLMQDRLSQEREPKLNVEVVEIYAERGALIRYASLQHWGEGRMTVSVQNVRLKRDARLLWLSGSLGGAVSKEFLRTDLLERGAHGEMYGFTFGRRGQMVDQSTYQHHRAPQTTSNLLFRNVLQAEARTVFYGMIRVEPEAQQTQGYQANNNLLLDDARAHSIPGLEIIANDVQCSHGSTVSHLDAEQLFYLQARGIPRPQAEYLITQGFLEPIVHRFPLACLRDRLRGEIADRFWGEDGTPREM